MTRRVLLACELGGGLGYGYRMASLARRYAAGGYEIHFALPVTIPTQHAFPGITATFHRPPTLSGTRGEGYAASYAEILLRSGWAEPAALTAAVRGWLSGFRHIAPDLLVVEFAPTAMLAARAAGLPVVAIGTGFSLPPMETPMPFTQAWATPPPGRLEAVEAAALRSLNAALGAVGAEPLPNLAALFDVKQRVLFGFPELSHYPQQAGLPWVPPFAAEAGGARPEWPSGQGPRVFAYLQAAHPHTVTVLRALAARRLPMVVHIPGLTGSSFEALVGPEVLQHVRLCSVPVSMKAALASCEVVVCHGIGTLSAALAAGKRVLHLPTHLEQDMVLYRLVQGRLGTGVRRHAAAAQVRAALDAVLWNPSSELKALASSAWHGAVKPRVEVEESSVSQGRELSLTHR